MIDMILDVDYRYALCQSKRYKPPANAVQLWPMHFSQLVTNYCLYQQFLKVCQSIAFVSHSKVINHGFSIYTFSSFQATRNVSALSLRRSESSSLRPLDRSRQMMRS